MKMGSFARSLAAVAVAATTVAFPTTHAAALLVANAELKEACEVLRLGDATRCAGVARLLADARTQARFHGQSLLKG